MKDYKGHEDGTLTTVELYNKYHNVVYDAYNKYFKAEWLQEDLVACGEYGLYKGVREYVKNPNDSAMNFLYTYVLNEMSNEWVKHVGRKDSDKRRNIAKTTSGNQILKDSDGSAIELLDVLPSNKTDWDAITEWIDVKNEFSKFSDEEKLIAKYLIGGYRHHEIAAVLGISRSYASKKIEALRKKLGRFSRCY